MFIAQLLAVILAMLSNAPNTLADDEGALTAMSFNLRYGTANDGDNSWPKRDHLVMDVLEHHHADVVGLQEALAFQLEEITTRFPHYGLIGVGREDGRIRGEFSAILYDTQRFTVDSSGTFWLSDTPEIVASTSWGNTLTRVCTWARLIDRTTGEGVYVFNAHYDHRSQPSRQKSSELIGQRIKSRAHSDPALLMGDFNAGEANVAITHLHADNDGPQLVHAYRAVHPDETQVGTFNDFRGARDGDMIDHIFVTADIDILDADIDRANANGQYPSDHFPVWTRVRLP